MNDFGYPSASYADGFAEGPEQSAYPDLWRGLVFCSSPSLGPTGLTLFDFSGYGNHGVLTNMDAATDWVMSERGWVLDYDGVNDRVFVGEDLSILNPNFGAFCVWFQAGVGQSNAFFFTHRESGVNDRVYIKILNNGNVGGGWQDNSDTLDTGIDIRGDGEFHLAILVWNGANATLYLDGIARATDTGALPSMDGDVYIGTNRGLTDPFSGQIGPVSIYNRALNANEIMDMYLGAHPLTPIRGVVLKAADVGLLLLQSNMNGGMENLSGGFV